MNTYRDIPLSEWDQYDWIHVGAGIYLRGIKKTSPPDDGYVYVEITRLGDAEQKWVRAQMTVDNTP